MQTYSDKRVQTKASMSEVEQESRAIAGQPRDAAVNFDKYRISEYVDNGTFMYAKRGNLVDADTSGAKASTKHLESRLQVFQGVAFWEHCKADEGLYNNVGFRVGNFEEKI